MLGYVLHAPPISLATGQLTEDWALIDLDLDKINWDTFKGNVVYLYVLICLTKGRLV